MCNLDPSWCDSQIPGVLLDVIDEIIEIKEETSKRIDDKEKEEPKMRTASAMEVASFIHD